MTPTLSRTLSLVVVITLFAATGVVAQPQPIDLGTLGGSSLPTAINESGQVVGQSNNHAFLWTLTTGMMDLAASMPPQSPSRATAINNLGHVAGVALFPGDLFTLSGIHPFLWTPEDGMVNIEPRNSSIGSANTVAGMNDVDQVVGTLDFLFRTAKAFSWTSTGGLQLLGSLGGPTFAVDVNNSGLVVGIGYLVLRLSEFEPRHAFAWTESTGMLDLGTLGGRDSQAAAVNDDGQVVGWSYTVGSTVSCPPDACIRHAFLWTATNGMVSLGTLGGTNSEATAVNARGWVLGQSDVTQGVHAFLWTPDHGMTDLGGRFALDLNDLGQVVGWSATGAPAVHRGFVWTLAEGIVELPPLPGYDNSEAWFVNNSGYVVGISCNIDCRSTLWVVPVNDAQQQLSDTINLIASYNLTKLGTSLSDKLRIASNFLAAGQINQACGTLKAFLNQVSAQRGKALTVDQATELATRVIRIRNVIGC